MAMDAEKMASEVTNAILDARASSETKVQVEQLWVKICTVIVAHIIDNAEVLSGITVDTDVNVNVATTGTAAAQSGAGTGKGTGTTTAVGRIQ